MDAVALQHLTRAPMDAPRQVRGRRVNVVPRHARSRSAGVIAGAVVGPALCRALSCALLCMTVTCTTVALASGEDGWLLRYERTFGGRDSDHRLNLTVGPGWEYEVDETLVRGHPLRVQLFSTGPGEWSLFRYASTDTAEGVPASCSDGHLRCAARSLVQGLALFAVLYLAVDSVDDTLEDLNDQLAPEVDYTPTPIVLPADPPTTKE